MAVLHITDIEAAINYWRARAPAGECPGRGVWSTGACTPI